jgi:type III pantothenate kinase
MSVAVIDIGNTRQKAAIFDDEGQISDRIVFDGKSIADLEYWYEAHKPSGAILSSTGGVSPELKQWMDERKVHLLSSASILPFKNCYLSPQTLGTDRMASIAGAVSITSGRNLLLIDAGTCITYDIVSLGNAYLGGNISPGMRMRLQAMHTFTASLPSVEPNDDFSFFGTNTEEAIRCGAQTGLIMEIKGYIEAFQNNFPDLSIYVSGGDATYILEHLETDVIYEPDLVLIGLYKIFLCQ